MLLQHQWSETPSSIKSNTHSSQPLLSLPVALTTLAKTENNTEMQGVDTCGESEHCVGLLHEQRAFAINES